MKIDKKRTYENILEDLELIISKLNSTDVSLENSIKLYEEGIKLSNEADKELLNLEKYIEKQKKVKKNINNKINIEESFKEIEKIIENLNDENIPIATAQASYDDALEIIYNIESYLKKAKIIIKKYE